MYAAAEYCCGLERDFFSPGRAQARSSGCRQLAKSVSSGKISSRLEGGNGVDQENGSGRESASNQRNSALSIADHRCLARCEKICCDS